MRPVKRIRKPLVSQHVEKPRLGINQKFYPQRRLNKNELESRYEGYNRNINIMIEALEDKDFKVLSTYKPNTDTYNFTIFDNVTGKKEVMLFNIEDDDDFLVALEKEDRNGTMQYIAKQALIKNGIEASTIKPSDMDTILATSLKTRFKNMFNGNGFNADINQTYDELVNKYGLEIDGDNLVKTYCFVNKNKQESMEDVETFIDITEKLIPSKKTNCIKIMSYGGCDLVDHGIYDIVHYPTIIISINRYSKNNVVDIEKELNQIEKVIVPTIAEELKSKVVNQIISIGDSYSGPIDFDL